MLARDNILVCDDPGQCHLRNGKGLYRPCRPASRFAATTRYTYQDGRETETWGCPFKLNLQQPPNPAATTCGGATRNGRHIKGVSGIARQAGALSSGAYLPNFHRWTSKISRITVDDWPDPKRRTRNLGTEYFGHAPPDSERRADQFRLTPNRTRLTTRWRTGSATPPTFAMPKRSHTFPSPQPTAPVDTRCAGGKANPPAGKEPA